MRVLKFNGKVYGAELNATEQKAMRAEINRQLLKMDEQYSADMDAMILYTLMAHYGWKKKRLKKFWKAFLSEHAKLRAFYQMEERDDGVWLVHKMLGEIGINIKEWYTEYEKEDK